MTDMPPCAIERLVRHSAGVLALAMAFAASATAQGLAAPVAAKATTPSEIVAAAPAGAWRSVEAEALLVLTLERGGVVAIELAERFSPVHVRNIKLMARSGWFDGAAIGRAQDNYVVQWGQPEDKALPAAVDRQPPAEYDRSAVGVAFDALPYRDTYAARVGFVAGQPAASEAGRVWLAHCYGMVGIGRSNAPDTGTGAELYAVIGHSPRHLDRNLVIAGRVLAGMDVLASRPRGGGTLGFYTDAEASLREKIISARIAADIPAGGRPIYEVLRTDTPVFAAWSAARANRKDDFFVRPAAAVDLCNAMPPVRMAGGAALASPGK